MIDTTDKAIYIDKARIQTNLLARFSQYIFAERWFPDAYVFVLIAVVAIALGTIAHGASPLEGNAKHLGPAAGVPYL
ncbi:hypothetical protein [Bradyrhizobium murdochi]|uniref:hypothetical protein n=1 Tax=Bradyrhizobium murdochi TaxID=1038859 RepID=UPI0004227D4D|nr:hypothetical protein [Bradyrhizobium murdochi]